MRQSNKNKRVNNDDGEDFQSYRGDEEPTPPREAKSSGDGEESKEEAPRKDPPLSEQSDKALRKKLRLYTEEFHMVAAEEGTAAMTRRVELRRLMRGVQDVLDAREPIVEVQVPASVTGEPFQLGEKIFPPGLHHVRASIAHYLLWLIDKNRQVEIDRLKSNGRTIDLGTIGSKARMATIARDEGGDHF